MATVKERVRALRKALGLTQERLAEAGGLGGQAVVGKIERGDNKASTLVVREGLARGFGLSLTDMNAYLEGELPLEEAAARARSNPPETRIERDPAPSVTIDDAVSPLEEALGHAFDPNRHTLKDVDAVRAALRGSHQWQNVEIDLIEAARTWLNAAASLRREGTAATIDALLVRVTVGKYPHAQRVAQQMDDDLNREAAERARATGIEPGSLKHLVDKAIDRDRAKKKPE